MNRLSHFMTDDKPAGAAELPPNAEPRSHQFRGVVISLCWLLNITLLVGVAIWILTDVSAGALLAGQWSRLWPEWKVRVVGPAAIDAITRRITWLAVLRVVAMASGAGILLGLAFGAPRHRRLRSWLGVLTLAAGWLALLTSVPDLAWLGQSWRIARDVPKLETFAAELRAHWPQEDGASDWLGPYSLYATGTSSVLTPLTSQSDKRGIAIRWIERSPDGALRFAVVDQGAWAWLEWHPEGSRPASFLGGLRTPWELEHASALKDGWFATAYSLDPRTPW
jgi:hypothetical protein